MKQLKQRWLLSLAALLIVGCTHLNNSRTEDYALAGSSNTTANNQLSDLPLLKNSTSIRLGNYVDSRMMGNPRKVGTSKVNAFGMTGKDLILDHDAADMVVSSMKKRLYETGFKVIEEQEGNALFELSGVVKELLYSVKARDEIGIEIESTLKNVATGKVLWSGIVRERNDHFEGVPRINKEDIETILNTELDIVSAKTIESISDSLMVSNPELFRQLPPLKAIPGVTVLVAPASATVSEPASTEAPPPVYKPNAKATTGMLAIITRPARAKVYIGGVYNGLTPFRLEMEAGIYPVSIKVEGYQMVTEQVMIRRKNITEMDLTLER